MNFLPRLSFLISAIPFKFPQQWFKETDKLFSSFLWQDKKPRIKRKKFAMPRNKGGLGVPDVHLDYLAYNARFQLLWACRDKNQYAVGSWRWLEERVIFECNELISMTSLLYHPKYNANYNIMRIDFSCEIAMAIHE